MKRQTIDNEKMPCVGKETEIKALFDVIGR